ncbi:MAG: hypothetical protein ABI693_11450 [Bryobacteraceae bacterium]
MAVKRLFVLALLLTRLAAAQSDAERIRVLEERVRQLEQTVHMLLAERGKEKETDTSAGLAALLPPTAPPPEPVQALPRTGMPQELLPGLGKIGASVHLTYGTGFGAGFPTDRIFSGSARLPLRNLPGGRLSYELSVGTLRYQREAGDKLRLLELVPFGLVYTVTNWDKYRLRPFAAVGMGNYVKLISAPQAGARLDLGIRSGAGLEWRFSRDAGLALDFRHNWTSGGFQYFTIAPVLSWHF